jgi:hypothetical protein
MENFWRVAGILIFFVSVISVGLIQVYRYYYIQKFGKEVVFKFFLLRLWQQGKNYRWLQTDKIKETSKSYLYSGIFCILVGIITTIALLV